MYNNNIKMKTDLVKIPTYTVTVIHKIHIVKIWNIVMRIWPDYCILLTKSWALDDVSYMYIKCQDNMYVSVLQNAKCFRVLNKLIGVWSKFIGVWQNILGIRNFLVVWNDTWYTLHMKKCSLNPDLIVN